MSDKNRKDSAKVGKENTITFYSCPKVQILGKVERFGGKVKIKRRTAKTPVSVFALKLTLSRVTEGEREALEKRMLEGRARLDIWQIFDRGDLIFVHLYTLILQPFDDIIPRPS